MPLSLLPLAPLQLGLLPLHRLIARRQSRKLGLPEGVRLMLLNGGPLRLGVHPRLLAVSRPLRNKFAELVDSDIDGGVVSEGGVLELTSRTEVLLHALQALAFGDDEWEDVFAVGEEGFGAEPG